MREEITKHTDIHTNLKLRNRKKKGKQTRKKGEENYDGNIREGHGTILFYKISYLSISRV